MFARVLSLAGIALAVLAVAAGARVDVPIPGSPVPQSLQTLAVVLVGGALGARLGAAALLAYLAAGAAGAPVFAGGASGWASLTGPTAGYLVGFVVGAVLVGWASDDRRLRHLLPAFAAGLVAHGAILGLGWLRLAVDLGAGDAWTAGVAPFLGGGVVKSLVAAALLAWTPLGRVLRVGDGRLAGQPSASRSARISAKRARSASATGG